LKRKSQQNFKKIEIFTQLRHVTCVSAVKYGISFLFKSTDGRMKYQTAII